jgi:hypothetical protein
LVFIAIAILRKYGLGAGLSKDDEGSIELRVFIRPGTILRLIVTDAKTLADAGSPLHRESRSLRALRSVGMTIL